MGIFKKLLRKDDGKFFFLLALIFTIDFLVPPDQFWFKVILLSPLFIISGLIIILYIIANMLPDDANKE